MRNIAIIPARSGSKGLKDKNIKILNGKPMIAYSIFAAQESGLFDEIMVSTDSEKYAEIAREYGANVPFLRTEKSSTDTAGSWDVVVEVLENYREQGRLFETVCLLQPTSPLRLSRDIINGYTQLKLKEADYITSMSECEHSPLWTTVLDESFSLSEFKKNLKELPRQKLQSYYRINGAVYIRKIEYDNEHVFLKNNKEYAYIMDKERSVDIDTEYDFLIAEALMNRNKQRIGAKA